MSYDGPFDPASGSPDARGLLCRVERVTNGGQGAVRSK
jgi:hypothetical protein